MHSGEDWTRERAISELIRVIEEGSNHEILNAVRQLNTMHGYSQPTKIEENSLHKNLIEVAFIESEEKKKKEEKKQKIEEKEKGENVLK